MNENDLSYEIIGAALEVHRILGPGLLESAYEECLCYELDQRGLSYKRQQWLPMRYKNIVVREKMYRIDVWVEDKVIVDIKSVEQIPQVYKKQVLTYLQQTGCKLGLLLNFNVNLLRDGIERIVNGLEE